MIPSTPSVNRANLLYDLPAAGGEGVSAMPLNVSYPNFQDLKTYAGDDPKVQAISESFAKELSKMHFQILDLNERVQALEKRK